MKNLTRVLVLLFVTLFCYQANAQTFGVRGGLNLANMLEEDDEDTYSNDYSMNPGFHLGLTVDMPINEAVSFESGLIFNTKGMKYKVEEMGAEMVANANLYYLDIPLTIKGTHVLGDGLKMYGLIGPYVGFGLSGKIKIAIEYEGQEETEEVDIEWGNDENEDDLKRLDMGLTFGAGVEMDKVVLGISYDLGLSNIASYQDYGTTSKNRVLKFSVGYLF